MVYTLSSPSLLADLVHDLFHQRIGIAAALGDFCRVAGDRAVAHLLAQDALQQRFAQHLHQTLAPAFSLLFEDEILLVKKLFVCSKGIGQFRYARAVHRHRLDDRRHPLIAPQSQTLHNADLALHPLRALAIALVDDEDVGDLHDPGLDALHVVAHAGYQDQDRDVGEANDIYLVLPHPDGLNQNHVLAGRVEDSGDIRRCGCEAAQIAARRHRANVDAGIAVMSQHADAITENGAAAVRAGGINGDDAHGTLLLPIHACELIDQRAFAGTGRSSKSDDARLAGVWEQFPQHVGGLGDAVFDCADSSCQGTRLARPQTTNQKLQLSAQNLLRYASKQSSINEPRWGLPVQRCLAGRATFTRTS